MFTHTEFSAGAKVKVANPGPPSDDIKWVKNVSINPRTRKQLIEGFWKGQRSISGHVAFVGNESDRERLRREGKVMVRISDLSAQHVDIIVPASLIGPA